MKERNEESREIRLQKIPLARLLSVLSNMFNNGIEYIDIIGVSDDVEDYVGISVKKEYLAKALRDKFDEIMASLDDEIISGKTLDDDINDLI